jgi:2-iminobutanoate/2-iminopropanoate deaminase
MRTAFTILLLLLVLFGFFLYRENNTSGARGIYTELAPKPIGPYSQAIKCGDLLFVSGQIALVNGVLDSSSIERETELSLNAIKSLVQEADLKMEDVSKCTIYMTDLTQFEKMNKVYASFFKENPPARECVEVRALPKGAHVEISAMAVSR